MTEHFGAIAKAVGRHSIEAQLTTETTRSLLDRLAHEYALKGEPVSVRVVLDCFTNKRM